MELPNEITMNIYSYGDLWEINCGYYKKNDMILHRENGPAVIRICNNTVICKEWVVHGKFHRLNGPATINNYAGQEASTRYLISSRLYEYDEYTKMLQLIKNITLDRNLAIIHIRHDNPYICERCQEVLNEKA
jgi:hypothetical protein